MAPRARIQAQNSGSDDEVIDINQSLSSDLDSDNNDAPTTRLDPSRSRSSNPSRSAIGGVGQPTELEQVRQLIVLRNLVPSFWLNFLGIAQGSA